MRHLRLLALTLATACTSTADTDNDVGFDDIESELTGGPAVVINEFTAGSSGKIELYNGGDAPADLSGWQVDDIAGIYRPAARALNWFSPARRGASCESGFHGNPDDTRSQNSRRRPSLRSIGFPAISAPFASCTVTRPCAFTPVPAVFALAAMLVLRKTGWVEVAPVSSA